MSAEPVRVLIVEDSEDQRELLRAYFEKARCEVTTAQNAEEGIALYLRRAPELAVVDLVLPGMSGWSFVEKLRADLPACAIAVASVLDARRYPDGVAVLQKPFTRSHVVQVLRHSVPRWAESA